MKTRGCQGWVSAKMACRERVDDFHTKTSGKTVLKMIVFAPVGIPDYGNPFPRQNKGLSK